MIFSVQQQIPLLPPIFLTLFCAWMLWGWCVGECNNIKWMRQWCAPAFVLASLMLAVGAGGFAGRVLTRRAVRSDVNAVMHSIRGRLRADDAQSVLDELDAADMSGSPDDGDFDMLSHLPTIRQNLSIDTERTAIAEKTTEADAQHF